MKPAIVTRPERSDVIFLALAIVALLASLLARPAFPMGDPAIFEYIGHAIAGGAHLYTDLWDNKLPSIYYINALWWILFGPHFFWHAVAETIVNAATVSLFALILRECGAGRWALATFVFAVLYLFVGGPLDQTEHYATPLTLGALLLGLHRRNVLAGVLLVAATTFWIPSLAIGAVPLLVIGDRRARIALIASCIGAGIVYALGFTASFGIGTTLELLRSWVSYQAGNYAGAAGSASQHYALPFLSPRYYVESGLGVMVALIAVFWKRDGSRTARFALAWTIAALIVVFALGRPSPHYFLGLYAPLSMLLALPPISFAALKQRWYFGAAAAAFAVLMVAFGVRDAHRVFFGSPASMVATGNAVRGAFGTGAVALMPWEIYLTADAVPPSRFFLAQGNVVFARERDQFVRRPIVFVDTKDLRFNGMAPPSDLPYVCQSAQTQPYVIHAGRPISGISCEHS
jgi:hypothetical protein